MPFFIMYAFWASNANNVIPNRGPTTTIRGIAPLYRADRPSSFTIIRKAVPMSLYFSLPPCTCNLKSYRINDRKQGKQNIRLLSDEQIETKL